MTNFLLFLIVCALLGIFTLLRMILNEMKKVNDLSKEDASVKAATEQVKEALNKLPKTKKEKPNAN